MGELYKMLKENSGVDERTWRLFACDCAEHVLPLFTRMWFWDKRPRGAIEVARRYANGWSTQEELDIAGDRAKISSANAHKGWDWTFIWSGWIAANCSAARDAADVAARCAAGDFNWETVVAITNIAARATAWGAWGNISWAIERFGYLLGGARAARYATWDNAKSTEKQWQTKLLAEYLAGKHG